MPRPAAYLQPVLAAIKTVPAPELSFRGAKRRGNLVQAVTISPGSPCYSTGYCEIAPQGHFLALRAQGATSAFGLLAMTNLGGAYAIESMPLILQVRKALPERRYRRNWFVRFYRHLVRTGSALPRLHPKGTSSRCALRAPRPLRGLAMTNLWLSPFYRQPALVDSIAPGGDSPAPTTAVRQPRHFLLFFHKCPPVSTRRA